MKKLQTKYVILAIAILGLVAGTIWYGTTRDETTQPTANNTQTQTTTQSPQTEESEDDEDYTKVVINPVSNITANQEAQLVTSADQLISCGLTRQTTEGPYYVSGTRALTDNNLNYDNLAGTPLVIAGYVYGGTDNKTPLANAQIEIWHTDDKGNYYPESNGGASKYTEEQLSLRGYITTDANGYFTFKTIYPGEYEGRARHIHVRATAEGYKTIVSQIIMSLPGDNMPATSDNIARALDSSCSAPSITNVDGTDKGFYSFWLEKN